MAARALLMLREASPWALAGAAAAVALLWLVAWTAEWTWWTPRRIDRALRAQGLKGTRYRLFTGDLAENARINREVRTKPLPLGCHDIAPRVQPMLHRAIKEYGNFKSTGSLPIFSLSFHFLHFLRCFSIRTTCFIAIFVTMYYILQDRIRARILI